MPETHGVTRVHSSDSNRSLEDARSSSRTRRSPHSHPHDRRDQDHYSRDRRRDKPRISRSQDRSQSYHSRDWDRHAHHRESRSSPQGRRDSFLSSFSSYEKYLDFFHRSGASNQGSLHTPEDKDSFGYSSAVGEVQLLPWIPRRTRDSPTLQTSSPSAASGAPPKVPTECPVQT